LRVGIEQISGLLTHQRLSEICVLNFIEWRRNKIQKDYPTSGTRFIKKFSCKIQQEQNRQLELVRH